MILNDLKTLIIKNYLILLILLISSIIFIIYLFIPISNPFISYEGTSNDFNLNGQNLLIFLDANDININSKKIIFRDVENIKKDGIDINGSSIQVENNNKNLFKSISNANLRIKFYNSTIFRKKYNNISYLYLEGNIDNFYHGVLKSSGDQITLSHNSNESISINGEEISKFSSISFEFDNSSSANFDSDFIRIIAYGVNEYEIFPGQFSNITLHSNDGILWVNDRMYNTKGTNLKFEMEQMHDTSISSANSEINFNGIVSSGKKNTKNILNSNFFYWFDQQPEKINALAALILALITFRYVFLTSGILKQSKEDQKIAYIRDRLEYFYFPLKSFFDSCETDECFNCNQNDPPHRINFDSDVLKTFNNVFKYQYLACPKLKAKMPEFISMLRNQIPDENEKESYLLFHRLMNHDSEILTIKNENDITLFIKVEKFVDEDMQNLDMELNRLIK